MTATASIALITKYSTDAFDKVYKADATSSILSKNNSMIQFTGAKTVKVAKLQFGGLNNYYSNNFGDERRPFNGDTNVGYGASLAGITWEEHTLTQDRAAKYVIEEFDNEESGELILGNAITEINRTVIVPEVDAYCWSTVYKNAGVQEDGAVTAGTELATLNKGLLWMEEHEVPADNQVIVMSPAYANALRNNNKELTHFMTPESYNTNVSFSLSKYEGRDIVLVPPARFMTDFDFTGNGYKAATDAKMIDFIVMGKDSATHVVKFQKTKILSGDVATAMSNMDGYVLLARIYHDVFVFDNKKVGIYAHTGSGVSSYATDAKTKDAILGISAAVYTKTDKSGKTLADRIVILPGEKFALVGTAVSDALATGTTVDAGNFLPLRVGDEVTGTVYVVDSTMKVIGTATVVSK